MEEEEDIDGEKMSWKRRLVISDVKGEARGLMSGQPATL